jgi:hypothetical protein
LWGLVDLIERHLKGIAQSNDGLGSGIWGKAHLDFANHRIVDTRAGRELALR